MKRIVFVLCMILSLAVFGQKKKLVVDINYLHPFTTQKYQQINHKYFSLIYSDKYRQSFCSYYKLTKEMSNCELKREDHFVCDSLVKGVMVKPSSYIKSGYDKGHLACQADMCFDKVAMDECFYMSNMSPQVPGFNRGIWKKLEHQCREWSSEKGDLYIFTGAVLEPNLKKFSKDSISVPEFFYKVIIYYDAKTDVFETIAFLIPHQDIDVYDLNDYIVPIDTIEEKTKLDFLKNLSDPLENKIEQFIKVGNWIIN